METGYVKTIVGDRGFGFVKRANGEDAFFHAKDLIDIEMHESLKGREVRFEIESNERGPRARQVRVVR